MAVDVLCNFSHLSGSCGVGGCGLQLWLKGMNGLMGIIGVGDGVLVVI